MAEKKILEGYPDLEKGAYLGAIASIATSDRQATQEEMEFIDVLCASADLSEQQTEMIRRAATELEGNELKRCLDILKQSDLKFSLITDMISLAESDQTYSQEEKDAIEKIAKYLNVNKEQFSLLDEFSQRAKEANNPEDAASPSFLQSTGLQEKMQNAGINTGGLLKGLLGVMGPIILGGMLSGGRRGGGLLGGLGGMLGGRGSMMGGGPLGGGGGLGGMLGGLGSLTGMLGGGGFRRPGGMLGGMFGF